jgi:nicotinamidase-related amidase
MNKISIDKSKTALVVIDLQKGIVNRDAKPYTTESVVKNATMLAEALASTPYTRHSCSE